MGEIRDPIHGFIDIPDDSVIWKLIRTEPIQRLRRIRQLAMAYLVYPGANHTRFDHSLGVMHVATRIFDKLSSLLGKSIDTRRVIELTALLHDIGHGPFSHVSEPIWEYFSKVKREGEFHEEISKFLILYDSGIRKLISEDYRKQIIGILSKGKTDDIYTDDVYKESIITGPMDADKIDYFLRDSYFCGVEYGRYDLERLLNVLSLHQDGSRKEMVIKKEGLETMEQFFLARYYLTSQVYYHKVRRVTDEMIIRGIILGIEEDEITELKKIYQIDEPSDEYLEVFLKSWDEKLVAQLVYSDRNGYAKDIFTRLLNRNLFKLVRTRNFDQLKLLPEVKNTLATIDKPEQKKIRRKIEKEIAKILKIDNDEMVIVSSKNRTVPYKIGDEDQLLIKPEVGEVETALQASHILEQLKGANPKQAFEVMFPTAQERIEKNKKDRIRNQIEEYLQDLS